MPKISLQNPNLQVRRDAFVDDSSYNEISNLMRDVKKQFQTLADAINYLYGPREREIALSLSAAKAGGTKIPTWVQVADDGAGSSGIFSYAFDSGSEEQLFIIIHLDDYYTLDADLSIDIHWAPIDGTSGNIVWGLEYSWTNADDVIGNTSTIEVTVAAPGVANETTEDTLGTLIGSGKLGHSILLGRFYRNAGDAADTYGADAFAFTLDFHVNKTIV